MRIQIALFFIFCCFLVVNCNKDKVIPAPSSTELNIESRSISDANEVGTLKSKVRTLHQQVRPYLSLLSPSELENFKVNGGAQGSFMVNNQIIDPEIRATVMEMLALAASVNETHGEETMKNAIFDGSLEYLIDTNDGGIYDVDIFALGTPCFDQWETNTQANLLGFAACMGLGAGSGVGVAACVVSFGISQWAINETFQQCLESTYGGG